MGTDYCAYHLYFSSALHPGIESIGQEKIEETVRSDTLWGALVQCWLLLFGNVTSDLFNGGMFSVSSCFPIMQGTRFFPLPIGSIDHLIEKASKKPPDFKPSVKDLKKAKYVSEFLLLKLLKGDDLSFNDIVAGGEIAIYPSSSERKRFLVTDQRPRIRMDQLSGTVDGDAFFYCSDTFFEKDSGLFFLATFESDNTRQKFEAALRLLGDTGLGADRSVGRGRFSFEVSSFSIPEPANSCRYLLLSLYRPSRKEVAQGVIKSDKSRYLLIRRSGRAASIYTSRFRRADTWMLAEGSILPFKPEGTVPKVLKKTKEIPHDVYRYGRAFTLPIPD